MQTDREFGKPAERLAKLMHLHLGLGKGPLATRVKRARHRLPRKVKRDVLTVAQAQHLSGHPRIARQIDREKVDQAYQRALAHLAGPEMEEQKKTRMIGAVTSLAVNLLLVFFAVLAVLLWRDIV